jgi:hypothetical protein
MVGRISSMKHHKGKREAMTCLWHWVVKFWLQKLEIGKRKSSGGSTPFWSGVIWVEIN